MLDKAQALILLKNDVSHFEDSGRNVLVRVLEDRLGQYLIIRSYLGVGAILDLESKYSEGINSFYSRICEEVSSWFKRKNKPLFLAGHSIGGAVASLLFMKLGGAQLFTFGAPPIFEKKYESNKIVFRFVNTLDPIPHIPGYHLGDPICVNSGWLLTWNIHKKLKDCWKYHSLESYGR